jgi:membrane fusion protein, adhesin transport system
MIDTRKYRDRFFVLAALVTLACLFYWSSVSKIGQAVPASVKLDAYDFTIYGSLRSKVTYVSPDAIAEKTVNGELTYYSIQVALSDQDMAAWNKRKRGEQFIELQPGMTGSIDVHTGERTLLSYLTRPISKTLDRAMSER